MSFVIDSQDRTTVSGNRLRSRRPLLRLVAAALTGLALLAGPAAAEAPRKGGTVTFADTALLANTKSTGFTVNNYVRQIADPLFNLRDDYRVEAHLARDWSISEDGLEYTLWLRDDVTFSDGTPLNAEIVKRNLDRYGLGDPDKGVPAFNRFDKYESAEVIDDHTLRFRLSSPNVEIIRELASAVIYGAATLDQPDYDRQSAVENLIGTGPFVLESYATGIETVLVRREDYAWAPPSWSNQGAAFIDRLVFRGLPEGGLRAGAVISGQLHLVRGVAPIDEQAVRDAGFVIHAAQYPTQSVNHAILRPRAHPQLADVRVRRALQIGIDRQALVDTVLSPSYLPAVGFWDRGGPGFADLEDEFLTHDPDRANALLDEAGWTERDKDGFRVKDGQRLTLTVAASANSAAIRPAFEFVETEWRKLGVELINYAGDNTVWTSAQKDTSYALLGVRSSPAQVFTVFIQRSGLGNDPQLQAAVDTYLGAQTDEEKERALEAFGHYIIEQGYVVILFDEVQVHAADPRLKLDFSSSTTPIFQSAWFAEAP